MELPCHAAQDKSVMTDSSGCMKLLSHSAENNPEIVLCFNQAEKTIWPVYWGHEWLAAMHLPIDLLLHLWPRQLGQVFTGCGLVGQAAKGPIQNFPLEITVCLQYVSLYVSRMSFVTAARATACLQITCEACVRCYCNRCRSMSATHMWIWCLLWHLSQWASNLHVSLVSLVTVNWVCLWCNATTALAADSCCLSCEIWLALKLVISNTVNTKDYCPKCIHSGSQSGNYACDWLIDMQCRNNSLAKYAIALVV